MRRTLSVSLFASLILSMGACDSASDHDPLAISEVGETIIVTYLDRDGDFNFIEPVDTPLAGMRVSLVRRGTQQEVARGTSDQNGAILLESIPVGSYDVLTDSAVLGDTLGVATIQGRVITIGAVDTARVFVVADVPSITIRSIRAARLGKLVSVVATALTQPETFGDSTVHLADSTGFMLATGVPAGEVPVGNQIRIVGRVGLRGGQRVLQSSMVFVGGDAAIADPLPLTTAAAATADGGTLDAALVSIEGAAIVEAAGNAAGDVRLIVDDGSGVLELFLDRRVPFSPDAPLAPGVVVNATGFLVPTGTGNWRLRPREDADLDVSVTTVTIAEARALAPGRLVAVEGVAITGWQSFADSTLHIADASGAIRGLRIPSTFAFVGDRVRFVGILRLVDLQMVLDRPILTMLGGQGAVPSPVTVSAAVAATANNRALDAALVRVSDVVVTDTATLGADFLVTVEDTSANPLAVLVDGNSDVRRDAFLPGARFDLVGVLVPAPGGASFRLKPRGSTDVQAR